MPAPLIQQLTKQFRDELDQQAASATDEMTQRWLTIERELEADILALSTQAANDAAAGKIISIATLGRMERYLKLMAQVQDQIGRFNKQAAIDINQLQQSAIAAGFQQSVDLVNAATGAGPGEVIIQFDRLGVEATQNILAIARAGLPLDNILKAAYPTTANAITDRLLYGTAMGWNPRKTAQSMVKDGLAQGLQHVLLVSRDQQIRGFREAGRQTYERSGVVHRYKRMAALQNRTCLACLALDGTIYDTSELMALHPQDRCSMIPLVDGFPEPQWKTGKEWFNEQPAAIQRQMLGRGKYEAWKDGKFEFKQLATIKDNKIWGPGAQVTSLSDLLKGKGGLTGQPTKPQSPPPAPAPTLKPGEFRSLQDARDWVNNNPNVEWDFAGATYPQEANDVLALVERLQKLNPNLKIDITKAHADAVLEGFGQLEKLAKEWPEVMARLETITTYGKIKTYDWSKRGAFAHATMDGTLIGLNPKYWGNPSLFRGMLQTSKAEKWLTGDTIAGTMTHEFGHQVDNWLRTQNKAFRKVISADGFGIVSDTLDRWRKSNQATKSLSRYATSNTEESFAEAFESIYHNPKKEWATFTKRFKGMLDLFGDSSKWQPISEITTIRDLPQNEREAVSEEIQKLKKKLNYLY